MKNDAAACVKCCLSVMERSEMIDWVNHSDDGDGNYDSADGVGDDDVGAVDD